MTSGNDDLEKDFGKEEVETLYGQVGSEKGNADAAVAARTFEAPEWIRNLTPEERLEVETRLKRKIDLRLMPMIIISMF